MKELAKLPDKVFELENGKSCEFKKCPFYKECLGGNLAKTRNNGFLCDIKKLKETYKYV
jgi:hypothetical protein